MLKSDYFRIEIDMDSVMAAVPTKLKSDYFRIEM